MNVNSLATNICRFRFTIGFLLALTSLCAFVGAGWLYLDFGGAQLALIAGVNLWLCTYAIRRIIRGSDRDPKVGLGLATIYVAVTLLRGRGGRKPT